MDAANELDHAAVRIADMAKKTAVANTPRMNPDAASLIWENTYRAVREEFRCLASLTPKST